MANDASEAPVLNSWTNQLGIVNELVVQFEVDACLGTSEFGAAVANDTMAPKAKRFSTILIFLPNERRISQVYQSRNGTRKATNELEQVRTGELSLRQGQGQ